MTRADRPRRASAEKDLALVAADDLDFASDPDPVEYYRRESYVPVVLRVLADAAGAPLSTWEIRQRVAPLVKDTRLRGSVEAAITALLAQGSIFEAQDDHRRVLLAPLVG